MLELLYADVCSSVVSPSEACTSANKIVVGSQVIDESPTEESGQNHKIGGLSWRVPQGRKMEDYLLFWIGLDNQAFANVVLTFNNCEIGNNPYYLVSLFTMLMRKRNMNSTACAHCWCYFCQCSQ